MFKILGLLKYLPLLFTIIPSIEVLMKDSSGVAKKNAVIQLIKSTSDVFGWTITEADLKALDRLINAIVTGFNKSGVFSTDETPVAVPNITVPDIKPVTSKSANVVAGTTNVLLTPDMDETPAPKPTKANDARMDELEAALLRQASAEPILLNK